MKCKQNKLRDYNFHFLVSEANEARGFLVVLLLDAVLAEVVLVVEVAVVVEEVTPSFSFCFARSVS